MNKFVLSFIVLFLSLSESFAANILLSDINFSSYNSFVESVQKKIINPNFGSEINAPSARNDFVKASIDENNAINNSLKNNIREGNLINDIDTENFLSEYTSLNQEFPQLTYSVYEETINLLEEKNLYSSGLGEHLKKLSVNNISSYYGLAAPFSTAVVNQATFGNMFLA